MFVEMYVEKHAIFAIWYVEKHAKKVNSYVEKHAIFAILHVKKRAFLLFLLYIAIEAKKMLKRKIFDELMHWRKTRDKECLVLYGPRQVGKTTIVEEFGKTYKSFIKIDFVKSARLKAIFEMKAGDEVELSSENILKRISANIPEFKFIENDTLIFLDEIQACGEARTALKYLAMDTRYDVIASGSLLGLAYGQDADPNVHTPSSIPVGFEAPLTMYSLDFEEFLWAYGCSAEIIDYLRGFFERNEKVPPEVNSKYEELFREFMVVGGMPKVVADFMENKDFNRVSKIQKKIIKTYHDDIVFHAKGVEKVKVMKCFDSVPRQLSKENKKFQYSKVESGKTSRFFVNSIQWLEDSGLVNVCFNVYEPYIPLIANENEDMFKLYYHDTGLLCSVYGFEARVGILNGTLKGNAKGALYENVISELLVKKGYKLHYLKNDDSTLEIEFLLEKNGEVVPLEVKAGNTSTLSLNSFIDKWKPSIAYKLVEGNVGVSGSKKTIPHYMVMFL